MRLLKKLFKLGARDKILKAREIRAKEIESMGLELIDDSGWVDGKYVPKRYLLKKGEETVAGPFATSSEALAAARQFVPE